MSTQETKRADVKEFTIEERLEALYNLQQIVTKIDKIRILRGELPAEVQDIEDEVAGLKTRIDNCNLEIENLNAKISAKKNDISVAREIIAKKEVDQNNIKNNREYDAITKEIEFQNLDIQLSEKHINDFTIEEAQKQEELANAMKRLEERSEDLSQKKAELDNIIAETRQEEDALLNEVNVLEEKIEERLLVAFKRIRKNARNGLAVVTVERDACGGCFNKIPPQRQLDIKMRKKIIVCEYCGRILVDNYFEEEA